MLLLRRLTSSVDNQVVRRPTDRDRGDVADVLVRYRARAGIDSPSGWGTVNRVDPGLAFSDNVLERREIGVLLQRQYNRLGLGLKRRC